MSEFVENREDYMPSVWTPEEYEMAIDQGTPVEVPAGSGLRARVLRGMGSTDFEILGSDERRIVFIMGPDGMSALPGMHPLDILNFLGLDPDYVQGRIKQGYHFKLLVFVGGEDAPLATWDNALDMVAAERPELAEDIERHREVLRTRSLESLLVSQSATPKQLDAIELAGKTHPSFMTPGRYYMLSDAEKANPANLRRVLLHADHLGILFSGDGYTRMPDGQRGPAEYLVPNGKVSELSGAILIDLM